MFFKLQHVPPNASVSGRCSAFANEKAKSYFFKNAMSNIIYSFTVCIRPTHINIFIKCRTKNNNDERNQLYKQNLY